IKSQEIDKNYTLVDNKQTQLHSKLLFKWSRYNYIKKVKDDEYLLFNCSTSEHTYIIKEIKELIETNINFVDKIKLMHPKLYYFLRKKKFIVSVDSDDIKNAIKRIKDDLNSPDYFELFINPTLDCNLRCWYCYETLKKNSCINDETLHAIMSFIKNKVESLKLKEITISFFGGEPLLRFNKIILPIIEFTQNVCAEQKKKCYFCFTTNGVLLSQKIVNTLYSIEAYCVFQVPFDGNRTYHDKIKKLTNGEGTFDKVIRNVMHALSKGFKFIIRCNYTPENYKSFEDLISIFNEYAKECIDYGLVTFSYHKVWQANQTKEMKKIVAKYEKSTTLINTSFNHCYADKENSVVINYNGDVYKCTARDFSPELREGFLGIDGEIIFNQRYHTRMNSRFYNKHCLECSIFPICNVCSQTKISLQEENLQCILSYSKKDKEHILLKKIEIETE
ncbi:MAG: radical SAM protein, partial [Bacteroidales bacterium]